jgi:hypothetical protein
MKGKKKSTILEGDLREAQFPAELEARMADLERGQGRGEPYIGLSYSTRLWTFYMFDLMGITLMRRSAAAVTRKRSSGSSAAESSLPSTETLRHALRRANALEPMKAN